MIYISREQLKELRKIPEFVAYAQVPSNKITGGILKGKRYQIKKGSFDENL